MGRGIAFAVKPKAGAIYAPFDGVIESVFITQHAITLTSNQEIRALLHIGVDTVELNGDGLTCLVTPGQAVTRETQLAEIDLVKISKASSG